MPIFEFKYRDVNGKTVEDVTFSTSKSALATELASKGLEVLSIKAKEEEVYESGVSFFGGIPLPELARFSRYFAVLIKGNVTVIEALSILETESKNATLKKVIRDIYSSVEGGKALYASFYDNKKYFPKLFIDIVRVGELSGKLYESFMRVTEYLEKRIEFRRKLRDALTYPSFLLFFIIILVAYVLTMLVPRFEELYSSLKGELPLPTQILLMVGRYFRENLWLIFGVIFLAITIYFEFAATKAGKRVIDRVKLALPVMSPLIIQYNITNFVKSVTLLFNSGYTFLNSLKESTDTVDNQVLIEELDAVCQRIEDGHSISESFKRSKYMPTFTVSMLKVGERSNNLYEMLQNISDFNEKELDYTTAAFLKIMEPVILMTLAFIVGMVLFAAYLPVLTMSRLIKV